MKDRFVLTALAMILLFTSSVSASQSTPVEIKNVEEQSVLLLKEVSTQETIGSDMGAMFGKVYAYMGSAGIQPKGPPLALYYTEPGPKWKIAVAVPVSKDIAPSKTSESIKLITLSGGIMASTMHIGPYEKLGEAWRTFIHWVESEGYYPAGPAREIYLIGPGQQSDQAKFQTQLLWPVH